jgi:hypothetical protein
VTDCDGVAMLETNKELVRRHFDEIFNRHDFTLADELIADD